MTQSELKELTNLGAELGAAKAEVGKLRGLLDRTVTEAGRTITTELRADIDAALSQQAEPTDAFTAADMATAAAQGFRDGQAAAEQAAAQDERELPPPYGWVAVVEFFTDRAKAIEAAEKTPCIEVYSRPQMLTRPAQTDPQPEQSETVLVPVSVIEEAAHMLEAHSPGSGSVESFTAQDLRAALSAQGAGDASA